jgi:hypothetical protein
MTKFLLRLREQYWGYGIKNITRQIALVIDSKSNATDHWCSSCPGMFDNIAGNCKFGITEISRRNDATVACTGMPDATDLRMQKQPNYKAFFGDNFVDNKHAINVAPFEPKAFINLSMDDDAIAQNLANKKVNASNATNTKRLKKMLCSNCMFCDKVTKVTSCRQTPDYCAGPIKDEHIRVPEIDPVLLFILGSYNVTLDDKQIKKVTGINTKNYDCKTIGLRRYKNVRRFEVSTISKMTDEQQQSNPLLVILRPTMRTNRWNIAVTIDDWFNITGFTPPTTVADACNMLNWDQPLDWKFSVGFDRVIKEELYIWAVESDRIWLRDVNKLYPTCCGSTTSDHALARHVDLNAEVSDWARLVRADRSYNTTLTDYLASLPKRISLNVIQ